MHSVSWKGGGAFFHAYHIAKNMVARGHEVTLLSISAENKFSFSKKIIDGIKLIESPDLLSNQARSGWDLWDTICRIFYLWNRNYDIVHCLDCRPAVIFPGLFLKYKNKAKLVIEWLDWFGRGGTASERKSYIRFFMIPIETFFEEKFRKFADGTVGLGEPLTQRAIMMGVNKNIKTILHGCDTEKIEAFSKQYSRKFLNLEQDALYLGFTGRMRGDVASLFVEIIEKLRFVFKLNVFGLIIGNTAYNIDKHINKRLDNFIIRTGWIDYKLVNQYMCACDILLLPFKKSLARDSIWPSKLNDYLSVGRPIISSKLSVVNEIFNSYDIGLLVNDDSGSFTDACIQLINSPQTMNKFGNNARKLAEGDLSWDKIIIELETYYKSVIFNK